MINATYMQVNLTFNLTTMPVSDKQFIEYLDDFQKNHKRIPKYREVLDHFSDHWKYPASVQSKYSILEKNGVLVKKSYYKINTNKLNK